MKEDSIGLSSCRTVMPPFTLREGMLACGVEMQSLLEQIRVASSSLPRCLSLDDAQCSVLSDFNPKKGTPLRFATFSDFYGDSRSADRFEFHRQIYGNLYFKSGSMMSLFSRYRPLSTEIPENCGIVAIPNLIDGKFIYKVEKSGESSGLWFLMKEFTAIQFANESNAKSKHYGYGSAKLSHELKPQLVVNQDIKEVPNGRFFFLLHLHTRSLMAIREGLMVLVPERDEHGKPDYSKMSLAIVYFTSFKAAIAEVQTAWKACRRALSECDLTGFGQIRRMKPQRPRSVKFASLTSHKNILTVDSNVLASLPTVPTVRTVGKLFTAGYTGLEDDDPSNVNVTVPTASLFGGADRDVLERDMKETVGYVEQDVQPNLRKAKEFISSFSQEAPEIIMVNLKIDRSNILGEGSFGLVFAGKYYTEDVAVKTFKNTSNLDNEKVIRELRKEVNTLFKLSKYPGFVRLFGANLDQSNGELCMVLELADGTLDDLIYTNKLQVDLTIPVKTSIAMDITRAMNTLHEQNLIFRDLKPQNVLVFFKGRERKITSKLTDFGLAKEAFGKTNTSSVQNIKGTLSYMSPELFQASSSNVPYSFASDVYALGVLLNEMMLQQRPFHDFEGNIMFLMRDIASGHLPVLFQSSSKNPSAHHAMESIIKSCVVYDPSIRPRMSKVMEVVNSVTLEAAVNVPVYSRATTYLGQQTVVFPFKENIQDDFDPSSMTVPAAGLAGVGSVKKATSPQAAKNKYNDGDSPAYPQAVISNTSQIEGEWTTVFNNSTKRGRFDGAELCLFGAYCNEQLKCSRLHFEKDIEYFKLNKGPKAQRKTKPCTKQGCSWLGCSFVHPGEKTVCMTCGEAFLTPHVWGACAEIERFRDETKKQTASK